MNYGEQTSLPSFTQFVVTTSPCSKKCHFAYHFLHVLFYTQNKVAVWTFLAKSRFLGMADKAMGTPTTCAGHQVVTTKQSLGNSGSSGTFAKTSKRHCEEKEFDANTF